MQDDTETLSQDIAQERDALAQALDQLARSYAPERLIGGLKAQLSHGEVASDLLARVKANPAAAALIGAGVVWLMAGGQRPAAATSPEPALRSATVPPAAPPPSSLSRGAVAQHSIEGRPPEPGFEARMRALEAKEPPTWWYRIAETDTVEAVRAKLAQGLEALPPQVQTRIRDLRERALSAQSVLEERAHDAAQKARAHPLEAALVALAGGAALGAALPNTRAEDDRLSAYRDRLMDEAEALLRAETAKLSEKGQRSVDGATRAARAKVSNLSTAVRNGAAG